MVSQLFFQNQNVIHQNADPHPNFNSLPNQYENKNKNHRQSNQIKSAKKNALFHHQEESKKTKFLIKLNRNIENALPSNFFSNPITSKFGGAKKYYSSTEKNQIKISLQTKNPCENQGQQTESSKIKMIYRYQSIQPVSQELILKSSDIEQTCRFRSTRSLQTSIRRQENKVNESYESEKAKEIDCNVLPKTAETLDNADDDIFNVTFGNGWNKIKCETTQNQHDSSVIYTQNNQNESKILRSRNVQSLELKKPCQKTSNKKSGIHDITSGTISEKESLILRSERKSITQFKKQRVVRMYSDKSSLQNPFIKNKKLNVDEIVKKKTLMLPKMRNPLGDNAKKDKLNTLMKLVF